jgi:hypothetical protein
MNLNLWRSASGVTHASLSVGPRTLCGKPIEGDGWKRDTEVRHVDESIVDCRRCRKSIAHLDGRSV